MAAEKKEKTVTADKRDQLLADALKAKAVLCALEIVRMFQ